MARVSPRTLAASLKRFAQLHGTSPSLLLPTSDVGRRYYEVQVLIWLFRKLRANDYRIKLVNGPKARLRWSGNFMNRSYSHFALVNDSETVAEIWTDVWVSSRKAHRRLCGSGSVYPRAADYRELDLLIVQPSARDKRPICHRKLILGVECKSGKSYEKDLWGSILGMRHFVSRDWKPLAVGIRWDWDKIPYNPPSILVAAALPGSGVEAYRDSMEEFGIQAETIRYDVKRRKFY